MDNYSVDVNTIDFEKIFLLSDLHFGVRSNSLEWLNNQLLFFENFYTPFIDSHKCDKSILFILGDWFDNRQLIDVNIVNKSISIIKSLSEKMPVYMMTGNHDIYKKKETDVNSLIVFKYLPNVTIIEKPCIISNGKSNILVLPWIGDTKEEEQYAKFNEGKAQFIFAHTDLAGFRYDNGRNIVKGFDITTLSGYKRIFSGHIHKRQESNGVLYIGSPYHTKRGDIGNNKKVFIFYPNTNSLDSYDNTLSSVFQRIHLEDLMEWTLDKATAILANNYTDIIVPDKYIHLFNLTKFIELLGHCPYKRIETVGEKIRPDDDASSIIDGENITDIITLLNSSIDCLITDVGVNEHLKTLNKTYYDKATKEETEIVMDLESISI